MKLLICTQVIDKNHPILGFFHGWVLEFALHFTEVHIICLQKGEYSLPKNVYVYSLGKEAGENRLKYLWRFYRYFSHIFFKVKVDFVFYHMGAIYNVLGAPFFMLRKVFKTKFYWWKTHGTITFLTRLSLLCCDRVYTASRTSFPLQTKKKYAIGHAIAKTPIFEKNKQQLPSLLFVGRVTPVKKIEIVLEIVQLLNQHNIHIPLRIVGALPDSSYLQKLEAKIKNLNIQTQVTIVGPKRHDELVQEFIDATVLINPSETGGIDKVVLEAMQFGVPPIALEKTYGEILSRFGLSVEKQDPVSYVEIIEKLLLDVEWRYSLSQELRNEVLSNHALVTLSHRIFNI